MNAIVIIFLVAAFVPWFFIMGPVFAAALGSGLIVLYVIFYLIKTHQRKPKEKTSEKLPRRHRRYAGNGFRYHLPFSGLYYTKVKSHSANFDLIRRVQIDFIRDE